ncbi:hypothetical protein AA0119_g469 [Alternaria tenuissima]|nr:hypothetical protein AA0115_g346 [Alternaria tenuissima]RYO59037.1 hypothetical protein AA0116_g6736 [Alternaria tenuissima]RYR80582.1 hypothetical protein AA0119_g469 [Alternaria tenuissima]
MLDTAQRGKEEGNNQDTENGIQTSEKSQSNQSPQPSIQLHATNRNEAMKNNAISKPCSPQSPANAKKLVEEHKDRDVVAVFGRYFISTPDLVFRIEKGIELNPYDRDTFYIPKSEKGYVDYPYSKEFKEAHPNL